ncbi:Coiled-coil domain-containing protein 90-like [Microdochium nivale]|nr:Coiled-coil domain-containing protein 90-like [Microdochium nivale]
MSQQSMQALPRFLLPRLSWTAQAGLGGPSSHQPLRAVALGATAQPRQWQQHNRNKPPQGAQYYTAAVRPRQSQVTTSSSYLLQQLRQPALARSFHATSSRGRDHHFDTLKFVQRLRDEGFTEDQSVAMMKVLNDVIEESIQNLTRTMVLREDAAKATYTQKVDFAKLRSELLSADSTESNTTRSAHERLTNDITKLNSRLRDEIGRTQASVRLDLNLEKGRIRDEAATQELKIKETESKMEQELAGLREKLEQVKLQTLQWLMGVCTGFAALMLGAWRLLM